jgi:hypothetical protein
VTRLQEFQLAIRDAILDARECLDQDAYRALLSVTQAFLTAEHLRVLTADAEQITKDAA